MLAPSDRRAARDLRSNLFRSICAIAAIIVVVVAVSLLRLEQQQQQQQPESSVMSMLELLHRISVIRKNLASITAEQANNIAKT
jgi:anti-sigma-K factor RskA